MSKAYVIHVQPREREPKISVARAVGKKLRAICKDTTLDVKSARGNEIRLTGTGKRGDDGDALTACIAECIALMPRAIHVNHGKTHRDAYDLSLYWQHDSPPNFDDERLWTEARKARIEEAITRSNAARRSQQLAALAAEVDIQALRERATTWREQHKVQALLSPEKPTSLRAVLDSLPGSFAIEGITVNGGRLGIEGTNADELAAAARDLAALDEVNAPKGDAGRHGLECLLDHNRYKNTFEASGEEGDNPTHIDGRIAVVGPHGHCVVDAKGDIIINVRSGYGGIRSIEREQVMLYFDREPLLANFDDDERWDDMQEQLPDDGIERASKRLQEISGATISTDATRELIQELAHVLCPIATPDEEWGR